MRKVRYSIVVVGVIGAVTGSPVFANESNGYTQIAIGNYRAAENEIAEQRRMFPHDTDLLINLGIVYSRTGRVGEARAVFRDVLARPNEELDLLQSGSRWSHQIAIEGLTRLEPSVISLR